MEGKKRNVKIKKTQNEKTEDVLKIMRQCEAAEPAFIIGKSLFIESLDKMVMPTYNICLYRLNAVESRL